MEVCREDFLGIACCRAGGVAGTAIIWGDDTVAGGGEGSHDMAELVGGFREAMDDKYDAFLSAGRFCFDVVNSDLGVGSLKPDLAMDELRIGSHKCKEKKRRFRCVRLRRGFYPY